MPDLKGLFGDEKSGGARITFNIDKNQAKKLGINPRTNTETTINIFSDPELLDRFKEFCAEGHISEGIDFLSKLQKLYEEKAKTGQEPTGEALQKFYNENITAGAEDQMNFAATLRDAIDTDLENGKGLESFYSAAQEAFTLVNTNDVMRFKKSKEYSEASEHYALMAERKRLLANREGLDSLVILEKTEAIDEKIGDKELAYFTTLKVKREEIFEEFKTFEAAEEQRKSSEVSEDNKILDAAKALEQIKNIDLRLSKNESVIVKNTENKKWRLTDFKKEQQDHGEPEKIKKIESRLFEALINERKQLLESAKDFKSSDPEALEKIKYVNFKLTQNESAILKRFENNKEKLDAFTEARKSDAPQLEKFESTLFDALTNERKQFLESVKDFKSSDPEALKTIKHVDFKLAQNESTILKRFANNKEKLDAFTEALKNEAPQPEKIESALFDTLRDERKQLLEEQSVILKASAKTPISLENEKKLEEIKGKLEANAAYIETRFNKVDGKNSNADIEKMRIFRDMLAQEEQQPFNELITKQNVLFSARLLEKDPIEIATLDGQLADNKAAIEMMLDTARQNTDPSKQKDFKERTAIFESLTEMQKEKLKAELAKTTPENTSTPEPEPKDQPKKRMRKNLTKTLAVEDPFYPLLRQREDLFAKRLNEKDPGKLDQINEQLAANRQTIELIIHEKNKDNESKEKADIFRQMQQKKADIFRQVQQKEVEILTAAAKKAQASRRSPSESRGSQSESRGSQSESRGSQSEKHPSATTPPAVSASQSTPKEEKTLAESKPFTSLFNLKKMANPFATLRQQLTRSSSSENTPPEPPKHGGPGSSRSRGSHVG